MKSIPLYLLLFILIIGSFLLSCNSSSTNPIITTTPKIISLSASSLMVGQTLTITGENFDSTRATSYVEFNGVNADSNAYSLWSSTQIKVKVPANATTGNVVVHVKGQASNGVLLTILKNGIKWQLSIMKT